jgi:hypothetical protein
MIGSQISACIAMQYRGTDSEEKGLSSVEE